MNYSSYLNNVSNSSDRFIPLRNQINWQIKINSSEKNINSKYELSTPKNPNKTEEKEILFKSLLQNELTGTKIYDLKIKNGLWEEVTNSPTNLFTYSNINNSTPLSPVSHFMYSSASQNLLKYNSICDQYKISPQPFKILDAPKLVDDFYFNLLDWSSTNIICIALTSDAYLWLYETEEVVFLCNVYPELITSVSFHENGKTLAMGTDRGKIHIWDIETRSKVRSLKIYKQPLRINSLSWNDDVVISGGGKNILKHNVNYQSRKPIQKLVGHDDKICGLKLSCNKNFLASGGNDNLICVWDSRSSTYMYKFMAHVSAVKALAWSPHQHSVFASGGGAQDRTIRIWSIQSGKQIHVINTDSQVCNLAWSKFSNDFLSTHGFPNNDINIWSYSKLKCVANLHGHSTRTLYMASSPHGNNIATAGGEELRLWQVFKARNEGKSRKSALDLFGSIR